MAATSSLTRETYDVIIVGGGTAGCVLANRLSEDRDLQVLMLEAGGNANDDPRVSTPGLFVQLMGNPERDWNYVSEPSPELNNRRMGHPRGKCIGGSSCINVTSIIYPSKTGMDTWADLGNEGWNWDGLAPYYRKFHTHVAPSDEIKDALALDYIDPKLQGTDGPIKASYPQTLDPLQKAWIDTFKTLNKIMTGDPLSGISHGGFSNPCAVDPSKGERSHAGVEYYAPVKDRANLHVVTDALVERLEIESDGAGEVMVGGVTFSHGGQRFTPKAAKEVILSAGAFGSPQLLEVSGIGDARLLQQLGIKAIVHNPNVGENLQDHIMSGSSYEVKDGVQTKDMIRDPAVIQMALDMYSKSRSGPLAEGGGYCFAMAPLTDATFPDGKAGLKALLDEHLPPLNGESKYTTQRQHEAFVRKVLESDDEASSCTCLVNVQLSGHRAHAVNENFSILEDGNYITIVPSLVHPLSRGSVHIKSADAAEHPKIDMRYLSHPLDLEVLARHVMMVETIAQTEPLKSFLKPDGRRLPHNHDGLTLDKAKELVKYGAQSNYHVCGTCAMLPRESGGVVNERLKVHGVRNLRVVDASIFPIIPRGNIQSSVYATAEKAADIIKEDFGKAEQ